MLRPLALCVACVLLPKAAFAGDSSRLGVNVNFMYASYGTSAPPAWTLLPSLRIGPRFALLPRGPEDHALNASVGLQFGLEGLRREGTWPAYAFGVTAKAGVVGITRGGPFAPFLDLYALVTLAVRRFGDVSVLAQRFGLGLNASMSTVLPRDWELPRRIWNDFSATALFLVSQLALEVAVTPPYLLNPSTALELRLGVGF